MVRSFEDAMSKMTVLGQNPRKLIDCSEVIPIPNSTVDSPHLPAGKTLHDIEASCDETPFPHLTAQAGAATSIAPV